VAQKKDELVDEYGSDDWNAHRTQTQTKTLVEGAERVNY